MPVKVFIVEGREIVRLGIKTMIDGRRNIKLIGEAAEGTDALEQLKKLQPDVILMDMNASVNTMLAFTQTVKKKNPHVRILILTLNDHESLLTRLLDGGADGYLQKNATKDELISAIEKILTTENTLKTQPVVAYPDKPKEQKTAKKKSGKTDGKGKRGARPYCPGPDKYSNGSQTLYQRKDH